MRKNFSPYAGDERQAYHPVEYWSMRAVAEAGIADPLAMDDDQAVSELDALLRQAVQQKMVSDVPLGAFLSGGIDSSTVVALMQAQSERPVKTFTIGFNEEGYDEAQPCQGGGRAPGHRAYRAVCHAGRGHGGDPAPARPVR